jgi:hypothetical protein
MVNILSSLSLFGWSLAAIIMRNYTPNDWLQGHIREQANDLFKTEVQPLM